MIDQSQEPWKEFKKPDNSTLSEKLSSLQYEVTQNACTEQPFANAYYDNHETGIYVDVVSGEPLFLSIDKYDSGTGWPSFVKPINQEAVSLHEDESLAMNRTEVKSSIANSHLGHLFNDGPKERGGMRYCMNSASLHFVPLSEMEEEGYGDYIRLLKE